MFNAAMQSKNFIGVRFSLGVAGSAKANEVIGVVALTDRVRDDVMNVQFLAFPGHLRFWFAASLAAVSIALSDGFGCIFPVKPSPIMSGCPTFPSAGLLPFQRANPGRNITIVRAKSPILALACKNSIATLLAFHLGRSYPIPARFMVALHRAIYRSISAPGMDRKVTSTALALFDDSCDRLAFEPGFTSSVRRLWVGICATSRAVLPSCPPYERIAAFFTDVMYRFHAINISVCPFVFKYFDICVKRITDAHRQADLFVAKPATIQPSQEALDL